MLVSSISSMKLSPKYTFCSEINMAECQGDVAKYRVALALF